MPTYEYRCPDGHDFERFYRKISDAEAVVACPTCGKTGERRVSAGAGLLFKGSGFYLTDYGKNAHRTSGTAPKSEGGSDSSGGSSGSSSGGTSSSPAASPSGGSGGSESKPAPKPESKPSSGGSSSSSDK